MWMRLKLRICIFDGKKEKLDDEKVGEVLSRVWNGAKVGMHQLCALA